MFSIEGGEKDLFTERGSERQIGIGSEESREGCIKSIKDGLLSKREESKRQRGRRVRD